MSDDSIKDAIRDYILEEYLPGEKPDKLTDSTELITSGILDSLAALNLVGFLEDTYGIKVDAHEVNVDNLNTIPDIVTFVNSKRS